MGEGSLQDDTFVISEGHFVVPTSKPLWSLSGTPTPSNLERLHRRAPFPSHAILERFVTQQRRTQIV